MSMLMAAWPATPRVMSPSTGGSARISRTSASVDSAVRPLCGNHLECGEPVVIGDGDRGDRGHVVEAVELLGDRELCLENLGVAAQARPAVRR